MAALTEALGTPLALRPNGVQGSKVQGRTLGRSSRPMVPNVHWRRFVQAVKHVKSGSNRSHGFIGSRRATANQYSSAFKSFKTFNRFAPFKTFTKPVPVVSPLRYVPIVPTHGWFKVQCSKSERSVFQPFHTFQAFHSTH